MHIGLDFETYGSVDLPKHGLDRYVSDPHFRPLIACAYWRLSDGSAVTREFDFVRNMERATEQLAGLLRGNTLIAHNVGFELAVLKWLDINHPLDMVKDSAVVARAAGAASSLSAAAPQLLGTNKMAVGQNLIKIFSVPGKLQEENGSPAFDPRITQIYSREWATFWSYCHKDAELSWRIEHEFGFVVPSYEWDNHSITMGMNQAGWPVDLESVAEMQRRYLENLEAEEQWFRQYTTGAADLNLNSMQQLKAWCLKRGIKANSFDAAHVTSLLKRINAKMDSMLPDDVKLEGYSEVARMLETKQVLGGSSLKKLAVILNTTGADRRLRDQYMHVGAGQTWRTTGRGVQMQNLKRFEGEPDDMSELTQDSMEWDNDKLALNIRQCFTSSSPKGALIVGDFSSVESRGLAWQAGEEWKLQAYRNKRDVYKDLATRIFPGVAYEAVVKQQRQTGKVGELSCGYQAGGSAVQSFANGMGVEMSEGEAAKLVSDWREACPATVDYWWKLDAMLHALVDNGTKQERHRLPDGYTLTLSNLRPPASLKQQAPTVDMISIEVLITDKDGKTIMRRFFHGCHKRGRNIGYYKPLDRRSGDLWDNMYTNAKTKKREFHTIYGGKLAGILTQSFCREMFFNVLRHVRHWVDSNDNLTLIGQFHDEIVLDWVPGSAGSITLEDAKRVLDLLMSNPGDARSFPMAAEVKHDYRYTK